MCVTISFTGIGLPSKYPGEAPGRSSLRRFVVIRITTSAGDGGMSMHETAEIAALRTRLKNVNVEYSMLLRRSRAALKPVTLEALREQRHLLMARIAELRARESAEELRSTVQSAQAQAALMVAAKGAAALLHRCRAGWTAAMRAPRTAPLPTE